MPQINRRSLLFLKSWKGQHSEYMKNSYMTTGKREMTHWKWAKDKNLPANAVAAEDVGSISGLGRFPGGGNGNPLQHHVGIIPWPEDPSGLQSMGSQRAGHDWSDLAQHSTAHFPYQGFPRGASGKEPVCRCRRHKRCCSIPGSGGSPGGGHGKPLQHSWPENPMDRGAWQDIVRRVAKSQTWFTWLYKIT